MIAITLGRRLGPVLVGIALSALTAAAQGPSQRITKEERPIVLPHTLQSTFGADLFRFYCSNCHGLDGKGRPSRSELRVPPADLTTLSRRNNGKFPRERVFDRIKHGDAVPSAHGTTDMPVWGAIFRAFESSEEMVDARLENLLGYLESIQEP
jgi:mono/diheme cytochrome c family protein